MIPIIKVVGDFCNLRCDYCFYNHKDQSIPHVMEENLLEEFIIQYMNNYSSHLNFIWHGGEPLLAGLPFFEKALDIQRRNTRKGQKIKNSIQTNATLIDDDWAKFFKSNNFRIGISLDGNKKSHDLFRKDKKKKGSFEKVMRGIEFFSKYNIQYGVIQTITRSNTFRVKEDFDFFTKTLNIKSLANNVYCDTEGLNRRMKKETVDNQTLTKFLKKQIDLWLERDDPNLKLREIENFLSGIIGRKASSCSFNGHCSNFFCINYNGKVYPCDRFSNRDKFLFGDLSKSSLIEILNSPDRTEYVNNISYVHPECSSCKWWSACQNGCPSHRIGGIRGKYYYCSARKEIFSFLENKLKYFKVGKN